MAGFLYRTWIYNRRYSVPDSFTFLHSRVKVFSNFEGRGSDSRKNEFPRIGSKNPFEILGVSKTATYSEVKQRFLELALQHHPDHSSNNQDLNSDKPSNDFIMFRQAFESIEEDIDGTATEVENGSTLWTDEEFKAWYYEETGHADLNFRMDMKTRKEVIDVHNQQAQGGLDRGGMWEMARRMAEEEAFVKKNKNKIGRKVSLDDNKAGNFNTIRRRRRKK